MRLIYPWLAMSLACSSSPPSSPTQEPTPEPTSGPQPQKPPQKVAPEPPEPAPPELAESLDLIAGQHRWHLYDDAGLILGFLEEGFRKYTQEYARPFGDVQEVDGTRGRMLKRNNFTLRIPHTSSQATTLRLHAHGLVAGQKIRIDINGRKVTSRVLPASWTFLDVEIPEGILQPGENEVRVRTFKRSRSHWLAIGSMHLMEKKGEVAGRLLPSSPRLSSSQDVPALGGVPRMSMYIEVPRATWFTARLANHGAKPAQIKVSATSRQGETTVVLEKKYTSSQDVRVNLASFGGQLVRLTIELSPNARVEVPRLRLEKLQARPRPKPVRHVILWVVDALRSDRLSLYGKTRVQTPNMSSWAKHAIVYRRNQAAAPSSPPSHGSIQTGMIPRVHGVTGDKGSIKPGTPLLSSQARDAGIEAAYYGNNAFGMRRLRKPGRWSAFHEPNFEGKGIDCKAIVSEVLGYATRETRAGHRFLVSALPFEPHTPYRFHQGISTKYHKGPWGSRVGKSVDGYKLGAITSGKTKLSKNDWSQLYALYDGEIEHMDRCLGDLWSGLEKLGILEETAIVVTSDHGEGMYEHKRMGHAYGHYAELSNVPFVVLLPGRVTTGPWNVETATSNIDIVPTTLDLLGVQPSPKVQGESVLDLALRPGEGFARTVSMEYGRSFALRSRQFKIVVDYGGKEQLFDQHEDPTEQRNILGKDAFATRYMRDMVGGFLEHRGRWKAATWGSWSDPRTGFNP